MIEFKLYDIYPRLASDEGPPFGRDLGITTDGWHDRAIVLVERLVRMN